MSRTLSKARSAIGSWERGKKVAISHPRETQPKTLRVRVKGDRVDKQAEGVLNYILEKTGSKTMHAMQMMCKNTMQDFRRTYLGDLKPDLRNAWSVLKCARPGSSR